MRAGDGPLPEPVVRLAARAVLPRMAAIVSRGAVTHGHLQTLGLDNVVAGADLAFTLETTDGAGGRPGPRSTTRSSTPETSSASRRAPSCEGAGERAGERYVCEVVRMVDHLTEDLGA